MRLTEPFTDTPRVIDLSDVSPDKAEALELVVSVLKRQNDEFCGDFARRINELLPIEQPALSLAT